MKKMPVLTKPHIEVTHFVVLDIDGDTLRFANDTEMFYNGDIDESTRRKFRYIMIMEDTQDTHPFLKEITERLLEKERYESLCESAVEREEIKGVKLSEYPELREILAGNASSFMNGL